MDDWQETQQTTRHVHNRVGKNSRGRGGGGGGTFDVKRMLGTYEIKCPAAGKLASSREGAVRTKGQGSGHESSLEVYTLKEGENALIGELALEGVVSAVVLLAGSRKVMNSVVRGLEEEASRGEDVEEGGEDDGEGGEEVDEGGKEIDGSDEQEDDEDEEDDRTNQRVREFEKNSFRSPKFWMKWQGSLLAPGVEASTPDEVTNGTGYLVFSGANCQRFNGTISCETLEWDNVKITGFKLRARPPRDFALNWSAE